MGSERTISRICIYRRILGDLHAAKVRHVFSHRLAVMAGVTAAQVRRDIMSLGCSGSPARGYKVDELAASIGKLLDAPYQQGVALVGMGNLGRALASYFSGRWPNLAIVAVFDNDPGKVNRVLSGCPSYPIERLPQVVAAQDIRIAIIATPAQVAQTIAESLVRAGVRGILNFAPVTLWLPDNVYIENMDMTLSLEKVTYFARQQGKEEAVR